MKQLKGAKTMMNIEKQKEHFKNHIVTFTDYGNIKILDFKNPKTSHYRIRFLFEEDYYRLHISGDLGELIATNYNNMCYEDFSDFVHNTGYFEGKVDCHNRPFYEYDYEKAKQDLQKRFEDYEVTSEYDWQTDEEYREELIDDILGDLDSRNGLGSQAYDKLSEIDADCFEWIDTIGREETGILELYMLAFELAQEQLYTQHNKFKCINSFAIDVYDDDGFSTEKDIQIEKGSMWERDTSGFRLVGANDTIRLESEQGAWLEITEEHLRSDFIPC